MFTGGVGEHVPAVRAAALSGLERLGIAVDPVHNAHESQAPHEPRVISGDEADVAVLVVPTFEEWEIAQQALGVVHGG